jgi:hypothetical protein
MPNWNDGGAQTSSRLFLGVRMTKVLVTARQVLSTIVYSFVRHTHSKQQMSLPHVTFRHCIFLKVQVGVMKKYGVPDLIHSQIRARKIFASCDAFPNKPSEKKEQHK